MQGLSVSGGVDSMALCTLLRRHMEQEGWPQSAVAYTIDHGVRPGSSDEANKVGKWVTQMGFRHRVARLTPFVEEGRDHMPGNIETLLRKERLSLLSDLAKEDNIEVILTGHQQDDQYETVLQRLAFGSSLAGMSGIPVHNGLFLRPQLGYSKARLMATCEQYHTPWVEDSTNSDVTFAMRNAIRQIARTQSDLPLALRKETLLDLVGLGTRFRERLLDEVNGLIDRCEFSRELFPGNMKVVCPLDSVKAPPRILRNFIAALAQIFRSGKVEKYVFRGHEFDMVSDHVTWCFASKRVRKFNAMSLSFLKLPTPPHTKTISFIITPETPRRKSLDVFPLSMEAGHMEWKSLKWDSEASVRFPSTVEIFVREDRKYYIRSLQNKDIGALKLLLSDGLKIRFENVLKRLQYYPRALVPVLCHREGENEIYDSLPSLGINISSDVKLVNHVEFDSDKPTEEWVKMDRDRAGKV